jgi:hypothetical protein
MAKRRASSAERPKDWAWLDALAGPLDEDFVRAATEQRAHALREAAAIGFGALDRGEFKEFDDPDDLERYLNKVADRIIKKSCSPRRAS